MLENREIPETYYTGIRTGGKGRFLLLRCNFFTAGKSGRPGAFRSPATVSYTHLDVYKRQILSELLEKVEVGKGYQVTVHVKLTYKQFLELCQTEENSENSLRNTTDGNVA